MYQESKVTLKDESWSTLVKKILLLVICRTILCISVAATRNFGAVSIDSAYSKSRGFHKNTFEN